MASDGTVRGLKLTKQYPAYSLSKAMLLVAYLRTHASVDAEMRGVLTRMIEHSDNAAADLVLAEIGGGVGLASFAKSAGMTGFSAGRSWLDSRVTAKDQALFFYRMDRWVPDAERPFVRRLLGGVTPRQRWGIPAAAEPLGWSAYFKGGWSIGNAYMTQAARLELGGRPSRSPSLRRETPTGPTGSARSRESRACCSVRRRATTYLAQVL